jgi:hypothetical protein
MKMQTSRNYTMTWSAAFWLPLLMGGIELLLRIALGQPDEASFFPISLVASGISVCVATATWPDEAFNALSRLRMEQQLEQAIFIANLGFLASLCGVVLWIYLLLASFNEAVMVLLPFHPFWEALVYYLFSVFLTIQKAKVLK